MANKTPGSLSEASRYFFKHIWIWMSQRPLAVKIGAITLALVGLFILARLNIFGEPYHRYAKILLPQNIPYVDPPLAVIPLKANFVIENGGGDRLLTPQTTCYEGDHIRIDFEVGTPAWVAIFDVDAEGVHAIFQNKLEPSRAEPHELYSIRFSLDDTRGEEILYVIASPTPFSFEDDIQPYLTREAGHPTGLKGPAASEYRLAIPETFVQQVSYCRHLARE